MIQFGAVLIAFVTGAAWAQLDYADAGTYQVSHSVTVGGGARDVEVWIPVPVDDPGQTIEDLKLQPETAQLVTDDSQTVTLARLRPQGAQGEARLTVSYTARLRRPAFDKAASAQMDFGPYDPESPEVRDYTVPRSRIESDDPRIVELARQFAAEENPYRRAWAIYNHVIDHSTYVDAPARGALAMLQTKVGCCADYAMLFVAICRAAGIPARECSGFVVKGGGTWHSWAEFYLPNLGWIPCDPQAGDSSPEARELAFAEVSGPPGVALAKRHDITVSGDGPTRTAPAIQDSMVWGRGQIRAELRVLDVTEPHYGVLLAAGAATTLRLDMSKEDLLLACEEVREQGRACLSVAMSHRRDGIAYAAVFGSDDSGGRWQLYPEMTRQQCDTLLAQAAQARVMPAAMASCRVGEADAFTIILKDDGGLSWSALIGLPQEQFTQQVQAKIQAAQIPAVLAAHDAGHGLLGSAAFVPLTPGSGLTVKLWAPEKQFHEELDGYGPDGYRPVAICMAGKYPPLYTVAATRGPGGPEWDVEAGVTAETLGELQADWEARGFGVAAVWAQ